jgi:hypothetical protein
MKALTIEEEFSLMEMDFSDEEMDLTDLDIAFALEAGCECQDCRRMRKMGYGSMTFLDLT